MNAHTGRALSGMDHLRQSVRDILTTPIGTRVLNREYGSRLFDLVDAPLTPSLKIDLIAAAAEALSRWEPRLRVTRIDVENVVPGKISLSLRGVYLPTGQQITIDGIEIR